MMGHVLFLNLWEEDRLETFSGRCDLYRRCHTHVHFHTVHPLYIPARNVQLLAAEMILDDL